MGIYDRDYYRNSVSRGGFGHFVAWSITTWLIVINVVVFFADAAIHRAQNSPDQIAFDDTGEYIPVPQTPPLLTQWGAFSIVAGLRHHQYWRLITYQFLHASPWHLLMNMVGLYFFGPIIEAHFGGRRYLAYYLLCGLAGAAAFILTQWSHIIYLRSDTPLVGASAGIFGLLVASAIIAPHVQVFYYFMPVTILMLAIGGMLLAVYTVLATGGNAGGEAAHLGGGAMGFLLMKNQQVLNIFAGPPRRLVASNRARPRQRAVQKDWSKDFNR